MAVHHRTQHHRFGQAVGFRLDHQDRIPGTCNHEVEVRFGDLAIGRIENVFAVQVTDAGGPDRAVERNSGYGKCRGRAQQGQDIGIHFNVHRNDVGDDLNFIHESFRKQRADRSINQAAGQCLFLTGPALALEKSTRDSARGIGLFLVIDRQWKESTAGIGALRGHHGDHDDRISHAYDYSTAGLARNFSGFQRDFVCAVLKCLFNWIHYSLTLLTTQSEFCYQVFVSLLIFGFQIIQ